MRKIFLFILAISTFAAAAERKPLPQVSSLTDRTGAAVSPQAFASEGRWLLIYIQKDCRTCDTMLAQVQAEEEADPSRITVVFEDASVAALAEWAKSYPVLNDVRLLSDKGGALAKELKLKTAPSAMGIERQGVQWMFTNTRGSDESQRSILFDWID